MNIDNDLTLNVEAFTWAPEPPYQQTCILASSSSLISDSAT